MKHENGRKKDMQKHKEKASTDDEFDDIFQAQQTPFFVKSCYTSKDLKAKPYYSIIISTMDASFIGLVK